MKLILVFLTVISVTIAGPINVDEPARAEIVRYDNENNGIDGYRFAFETSDGVSRSEEGVVKNPGTDNEALSVTGAISWIAQDGQTYTINFIADENGFQPVLGGAYIPQEQRN